MDGEGERALCDVLSSSSRHISDTHSAQLGFSRIHKKVSFACVVRCTVSPLPFIFASFCTLAACMATVWITVKHDSLARYHFPV